MSVNQEIPWSSLFLARSTFTHDRKEKKSAKKRNGY